MEAMTDTPDYDFESPAGVRPPGPYLRALEARMPYEALSSLALWPLLRCGTARRRACRTDTAGTGGARLIHAHAPQLPHPTRLRRPWLGPGQKLRAASARDRGLRGAAALSLSAVGRTQGQRDWSEPGRRLCAVAGRPGGRAGALRHHAGQPDQRRSLGEQRAAPVPGGERAARPPPSVCRAAEASAAWCRRPRSSAAATASWPGSPA